MSYYIIPKIVNKLYVEPTTTTSLRIPYLSRSLWTYFFAIQHQLTELFVHDVTDIEEAIKLLNPYEYLFTNVPGSHLSVSKLPYKSNIFYDLWEIKHNLYLWDCITTMKTLHISPHYAESIACIKTFRDFMINDKHVGVMEADIGHVDEFEDFDFIYFETNADQCVPSFLKALITILNHLTFGGAAVIHIRGIFDKLVVDGIYLLSSLFHKVYISKPSTSNIATFDKYIVCKGFHCIDRSYLHSIYAKLLLFSQTEDSLGGLFDYDIPCYFRNKLDEINIIIGQQQIESLEMILSVYRNKNKFEKTESIRKANIQKSVLWCDKYHVPCNRLSGKINMFLPVMNEALD